MLSIALKCIARQMYFLSSSISGKFIASFCFIRRENVADFRDFLKIVNTLWQKAEALKMPLVLNEGIFSLMEF